MAKPTKFISLLQSLKPGELSDFKEFAACGGIGVSPKANNLLDQIYKMQRQWSLPKVDVMEEAKKSGGKTNEKDFHKLVKELSDALETFCVLLQMKKDNTSQQRALLSYYSSRKQSQAYQQLSSNMRKKLWEKPSKTVDDCLNLLSLSHDFYFHPSTQKFNREQRTQQTEELCKALDLLYATGRLHYLAETVSLNNFISLHEYTPFFDVQSEILKLRSQNFPQNALLNLYLDILYHTEFNTNESFEKIRHQVFERCNELEKKDGTMLVHFLFNFCSQRIRYGDNEYFGKFIDIFKEAMQRELLIEDGIMPGAVFINAVSVGVECGEFEWIDSFINRYNHFLKAEVRDSLVLLARAILAFGSSYFEETRDLLKNIERNDTVHDLLIRILELRTHYEIFYSPKRDFNKDYLNSMADAFRLYMRQGGKFSATTRKANENFLSIYRSLLLDSPPDKKSLLRKLDRMNLIVGKKWLAQKIELMP